MTMTWNVHFAVKTAWGQADSPLWWNWALLGSSVPSIKVIECFPRPPEDESIRGFSPQLKIQAPLRLLLVLGQVLQSYKLLNCLGWAHNGSPVSSSVVFPYLFWAAYCTHMNPRLHLHCASWSRPKRCCNRSREGTRASHGPAPHSHLSRFPMKMHGLIWLDISFPIFSDFLLIL